MKEYIDREAAIFRLREAIPYHENSTTGLERAISYLQSIPAADVVEVIHAHWVKPTKIGGRSVDVPHCSHCKDIPCGVDMKTHYCPNCGAKMDGGVNDAAD